jgi:predicted transcriptional regulator
MEKTTLYLPAALHRAVKEAARSEGRSQAEIMRAALEAYLAQRPKMLPRSIGAAADGVVPASESKAWVRHRWQERGS